MRKLTLTIQSCACLLFYAKKKQRSQETGFRNQKGPGALRHREEQPALLERRVQM